MTKSPQRRALGYVRALVDALYHSARAVESRTGLTNAQLAVLRQVALKGPVTINHIASRVQAGQNSVSTVVSRLHRAKLVMRSRGKDDRRRVLIEVTPAGRRALRRAPKTPTEELLHAIDRLSGPQAHHITVGVSALLRGLGRELDPEHMLFE
jgi:DNA-binding MarR family transcriptional regulator